jgi:hypothetical protein
MATTLKLAIRFTQHEVRQQWRERTALRRPLLDGFDSPSANTPASGSFAPVEAPAGWRRAAMRAISLSSLTRSKNFAKSISTTN